MNHSGLRFGNTKRGSADAPKLIACAVAEVLEDRRMLSGGLDTSWGTAGTASASPITQPTATVMQPDGKLLIGGPQRFQGMYSYEDRFAIMRFNADGSLDASFGTDGLVTTQFANVNADLDELGGIALQSDGDIVATGAEENGNNFSSRGNIAVARYTPNGVLDSTFGTGGEVVLPLLGLGNAVAIQPNGGIVVSAGIRDSIVLIRLNSNGTQDTTFGTGGIYSGTGGNGPVQLTTDPSNNILCADDVLVRLLPNGQPDPSFQTVMAPPGGHAAGYPYQYGVFYVPFITALALQPNGQILVTENTEFGNQFTSYSSIDRYNSNGTFNTTIGTVVSGTASQPYEYFESLAILSDGDIVSNLDGLTIGGSETLMQFLPGGGPDNSFGTGGTVTETSLGFSPNLGDVTPVLYSGLVVTPDQNIVVTGSVGLDYNYTRTAAAQFLDDTTGTLIPAGTTTTEPVSSTGHSVLATSNLWISGSASAWTGTLDITNNDADIVRGSLALITNQVQLGYASATWQGHGITSSTAAANSTHLTAIGVIQNNQSGAALYTATHQLDGTTPGSNDILLKYTYYGDTNLDGKVDGSDYSRVDNGWLNQLTSWFNGDFNYDGVINGSDYTLIDNAYSNQGASLASQISTAARTTAAPVARPASLFSDLQMRSPGFGSAESIPTIAAGIFSPDQQDLLDKSGSSG